VKAIETRVFEGAATMETTTKASSFMIIFG
jgi:hypothetical protein